MGLGDHDAWSELVAAFLDCLIHPWDIILLLSKLWLNILRDGHLRVREIAIHSLVRSVYDRSLWTLVFTHYVGLIVSIGPLVPLILTRFALVFSNVVRICKWRLDANDALLNLVLSLHCFTDIFRKEVLSGIVHQVLW